VGDAFHQQRASTERTGASRARRHLHSRRVDRARNGQGRRRAALIEDGLTLCDVCAPSGNHQPVRFER
jgi:hypothetical protein